MSQNLKIIESKDSLKLNDSNNKTLAEIFLNEYISKEDAESFLNGIKKQINIKLVNTKVEQKENCDNMNQLKAQKI